MWHIILNLITSHKNVCYLSWSHINSKFVPIKHIGLVIQTTTIHGGRSLRLSDERVIYGFPFKNRRESRKTKQSDRTYLFGKGDQKISRSQYYRNRRFVAIGKYHTDTKRDGNQTRSGGLCLAGFHLGRDVARFGLPRGMILWDGWQNKTRG